MALYWTAGTRPDADALNDRLPTAAVKTSATVRNNTAVATADPDLVVTLRAGRLYMIDVCLGAAGPTGADIAIGYTRTGTLTQVSSREFVGCEIGVTNVTTALMRNQKSNASTPDGTATYGTTTTPGVIRERFILDAGASGGTLTLTWAQSVATVGDTTLSGYMIAWPIS